MEALPPWRQTGAGHRPATCSGYAGPIIGPHQLESVRLRIEHSGKAEAPLVPESAERRSARLQPAGQGSITSKEIEYFSGAVAKLFVFETWMT